MKSLYRIALVFVLSAFATVSFAQQDVEEMIKFRAAEKVKQMCDYIECKRLHDDVLHISKKPLRGELSGFLSIYQAEASCISPKVY